MSKTLWMLALFATGALALIIWSFLPNPVLVETALVRAGKFQASFSEDGRTRLKNRYTIYAPFSGTLLRPSVKVGDAVQQGDAIAMLYSAPAPLLDARTKAELQERIGIAEANLEEAGLLLENARMDYAQAVKDFERIDQLLKSGSATQQQFDRAKLSKDMAERTQTAAEKRRHAAEHMLEQVRQISMTFTSDRSGDPWILKAPVSGTLIKIYQESEGVVSSGTPLFDIGDLNDLEIVADVLTTDIVSIRPGQRVTIEKWGVDQPLEGRIRLTEPAAFTKISALGIEEQRSPVVIDIVSPSDIWNRLGDQFRVTVNIITDEVDEALLIPTSALIRKGNEDFTFLIRDNVAVLKKLEVGKRSRGSAIVNAGLSNGDEVIIYPPQEIGDGTKITRRELR